MKLTKSNIGDLVEVTWIDAVGRINENISKAKPSIARNIGYLQAVERRYIVLSTGIYLNDGDDPIADTTVIPSGWFEKVKIIKKYS